VLHYRCTDAALLETISSIWIYQNRRDVPEPHPPPACVPPSSAAATAPPHTAAAAKKPNNKPLLTSSPNRLPSKLSFLRK